MITTLLIFLLSVAPAAAGQSSITGPAYVIDGDTVVVGTTHIRLKGVDAAERGTPLGDEATQVMRGIVNGSALTCVLTGEKTHHREVGYCTTSDGTDINREIIAMGVALACPRYSTRYLPDEQPEALAAQPRASYCVRR
jgi:endonuclease YncB( thermonuclease family)